MSGLVQMFDAAYPPELPYPGCAAVAGYIGGATPNIWSRADWLRFQRLWQLPIWTGYGESDPAGHARQAVGAARALGWTPRHAPLWQAIVLDMEGEVNEPWVKAFGAELQAEGFLCWPYLDWSALQAGGDPRGYTVWLPTWNGVPAVPNYPNVIAAQYRPNVPWDGTQVDLSVVDAGVLGSFASGPRA